MADTTPRKVVVTGLGATSPLGGDLPSSWTAALEGRSGARPIIADWTEQYELPVTFAAQLAVPTADSLSKVEARRLDPSGQMAMVAAREAWADAGTPEVEGERLGAVVASGIGGVWTLLSAYDVLKEKGARRIFPLTVPMLMPNGPAAAISIEVGARAGVHTPVSACASGAEAMAYAFDMIRSGRADMVLAGGTEAAIHPLPIAGFAAMQALSTRNDAPEAASRPYDAARDGFVLGEGAALAVLESEEHARTRGATIYAELASVGITS
ncbi:MAG TPA: beta-ketoacyl synthase N-terminal-like domain-containing protein, partial [Kineosporiaceae bacterium]|nr:beta-ketoacyl synthase N-terminal-like domain-containing protein [Kineosporiaceae bacterium]